MKLIKKFLIVMIIFIMVMAFGFIGFSINMAVMDFMHGHYTINSGGK